MMRAFWSDPYLWIHVAGIAALPLWLGVCLLGLAVGDPVLPVWLELGLVGLAGAVPIVWMQSQKPFYIFSLLALAVKPDKLTEDQRRLLSLFRARRNPLRIGLGTVALLVVLQQLYQIAPIAADVAPFPPTLRGLGLVLAAIAFLFCNLFLQVPLSVLAVMLTREPEFATTAPYAIEQIPTSFSVFGFRINQLLPPLQWDEPTPPQVAEVEDGSPAAVPAGAVEEDIWEEPGESMQDSTSHS